MDPLKATIKANSKTSKLNPFVTWHPRNTWPRRIVPGFAPSHPTYGQLHGVGMTEEDFQAVGSSWLIEHPCGILGDDMGLGKCKQTLDAVMHVAKHESIHNVVIVCKASNIDTWIDELNKWYPDCLKFAMRGSKRLKQLTTFVEQKNLLPRFFIMSYEIYRRDHTFFLDEFYLQNERIDWAILDEGQEIRGKPLNGKQSQISEVIHQLKPPRRHILSGTPIIKTVADWWNLGKWLGCEDRSWDDFADDTLVIVKQRIDRWTFVNKIVDENPQGVAEIRKTIESCMLRRTKHDQLHLPPMRKVTRYVRMTPREVSDYVAMRNTYKNAVEKLNKGDEPAINPFVARMRMEQKTSSILSKIEAAMNIVEEAEGQKILIFTKHLDTLRMLYTKLKRVKIGFVFVHGGVSTDAKPGEQSERGKAVHRFQEDPNCCVFIGTAQACRTGLTLTAASVVVLMDEEYSPKHVQQLLDRAHRIGQNKSVLAIRLEAVIPKGTKMLATIERQIRKLLAKQGVSIDSVVRASEFSRDSQFDVELAAALEEEEIIED